MKAIVVGKHICTACQNAAALLGNDGYEVEHVEPESQRGEVIIATMMALKAEADQSPDIEYPLVILEGWV